jgi:hypothetical protein
VDSLVAPGSVEAGEVAETRLVWQPLAQHPEPQQVWLHLEDAEDGGALSGNATLDLYPAREWEPDEQLLSRLPLTTEPTAIPDRYRLTLGMTWSARTGAASATWQGRRVDRVPGRGARAVDAQRPPGDCRKACWRPRAWLEAAWVLAARPPERRLAGKRVQVGLRGEPCRMRQRAACACAWCATMAGRQERSGQFSVVAPTLLRGGSVVGDEQTLEVGPGPGDGLVLEVGLGAGGSRRSASWRGWTQAHLRVAPSTPGPFGFEYGIARPAADPARRAPGGRSPSSCAGEPRPPWTAATSCSYTCSTPKESVLAQRDAEPPTAARRARVGCPRSVEDE